MCGPQRQEVCDRDLVSACAGMQQPPHAYSYYISKEFTLQRTKQHNGGTSLKLLRCKFEIIKKIIVVMELKINVNIINYLILELFNMGPQLEYY